MKVDGPLLCHVTNKRTDAPSSGACSLSDGDAGHVIVLRVNM